MGVYLSQVFRIFMSNHREMFLKSLETSFMKHTHDESALTPCGTVTSFLTGTAREKLVSVSC